MDSLQLAWDHFISTAILLAGQISSISSSRAVATIVVGLLLLRRAHRALTQTCLNNWTSNRPFDPYREIALVTGGCGGIGACIAADLAQRGVTVIVVDIVKPESELPYGVFFHEADVTSPTSLSRTAQHVRNRHGHPTILINNAGVGRHHNLLEASEADVRRAFDVNAMSHFWAVREFFPAMVLANHGHVVSVASTASFLSVGGMVDYACTKAAVLAFHEGLAQELRFLYKAPSVRTSIVHPVFVQTALIKEYTDAGLSTHHAVLEPADVAAAVVGQIITQNSGQVVLPRRKTWYSVVRVLPAYLQEPVRDAGTRLLLKLGAANKNG